MIVKKVKLENLKVHRIHSTIYVTNNLDNLKESIQESGLLEKIVVNNATELVILSGVRRYQALKELGYEETDVIVRDEPNADESLTVIAFNKQREKTNREKLNEARYLKSIWRRKRGRSKSGAEKPQTTENVKPVDTRRDVCEKTGYSAGTLTKLEYIDDIRPDLIDEIDKGTLSIDQAYKGLKRHEEVKKIRDIKSTQSALPTTISNSNYTIYNESSDNLSKLKDESIQTIFSSPPYFSVRSYSDIENELGSEETSEKFVQRMANHLHACYRVLHKEGSFFINFGDKFLNKDLQLIPHRIIIELQKRKWIVRQTIIWHKKNRLPATSNDNLTASFEYIFHLVKSKNYYYNQITLPNNSSSKKGVCIIKPKDAKYNDSNFGHVYINGLKEGKNLEDYWIEGDVVETACASQREIQKYGISDHPAPFPFEICVLPILQTSRPNDVVLDVFSGSGTTGEAALLLGRKYVGYELNQNFNEGQIKRLDKAIKTYNENPISDDLMKAA